MDSRFRPSLIVGVWALALFSAGCGDPPAPKYSENPRLATLGDNRPVLVGKIREAVAEMFGPDVYQIKLPPSSTLAANSKGTGIRDAGQRLATADGDSVAGGAYLYRQHCLHCHGISGDGNGPTGPFLYPRPRDFRNGVFKFISTNYMTKPTRGDLHKTIKYGLHNTSMPSFDALMTEEEIQRVIDYTIFLSIRGETEVQLIQLAKQYADGLGDETKDAEADKKLAELLELGNVEEIAQKVAKSWFDAESQQALPTIARKPSESSSIANGKALFVKNCVSCHGNAADGTGPTFIDRDIYNQVVFKRVDFASAINAQYDVEVFRVAQAHMLADHKAKVAGEPSHSHEHGDEAHEAEKGDPIADFLGKNADALNCVAAPALFEKSPDAPFVKKAESAILDAFKKKLAEQPDAAVADAKRVFPKLEEKAFQAFLTKNLEAWKNSRDEIWKQPLRPANLNLGVYKGGRRPLDIYLRIANGISSAKMPAHINPTSSSSLKPEDVWDLVNFVLALPDNPRLLDQTGPTTPATPSGETPKAAVASATH